jgi:hypothetical protein
MYKHVKDIDRILQIYFANKPNDENYSIRVTDNQDEASARMPASRMQLLLLHKLGGCCVIITITHSATATTLTTDAVLGRQALFVSRIHLFAC